MVFKTRPLPPPNEDKTREKRTQEGEPEKIVTGSSSIANKNSPPRLPVPQYPHANIRRIQWNTERQKHMETTSNGSVLCTYNALRATTVSTAASAVASSSAFKASNSLTALPSPGIRYLFNLRSDFFSTILALNYSARSLTTNTSGWNNSPRPCNWSMVSITERRRGRMKINIFGQKIPSTFLMQ